MTLVRRWSALREYRLEDASADLLAGAVVAIMLVPQAMAYSLLAGLPPEIGLYSATAGALLYPLLGSSRYLAVGPVAIVSMLVATGVASLAPAGPAEFLSYAVQLALLVGLLQLAMGICRLGFLVNFVSHAVLSGFTTAAAIVIGLNQVKLLLGLSVPRTENTIELVRSLLGRVGEVNLTTALLGLGSFLLLLWIGFGLRAWLERAGVPESWIVPITKSAPLVAVVLGALLVGGYGLDRVAGVAVVGEIPAGLPPLRWPPLSVAAWPALLPTALAISFVGFTESYAVARALASKRREKVGASRELAALGIANLAASVVSGSPITGGLSRSVVNFSAGARTGMASLVSATLLLVTLAFMTPLFYSVPHAVLAAIIVVAVAQLLDFRSLAGLWRYNRSDAAAYLITFFTVLVVGVEAGIVAGALAALALHLWRTSRPHLAVVGRVPETEHYRNVLRHDVEVEPGILAVRVDESLYFANTAYLEDRILAMVADRPEVHDLVLITSAVNLIDGSALETLERLVDELRDGGVTLHLAEVKGPVMDRLQRVGFLEKLGRGRVFLTTHQAFQSLRSVDGRREGGPLPAARRVSHR